MHQMKINFGNTEVNKQSLYTLYALKAKESYKEKYMD